MKKFLIPILVAGVLSSFATTTNVVYIDVNNLQDFEIQMSPETGETNVINFKVYQDRSALDLSGLTPVLYAARDEAISRNVITIEGSSSGNVATITTAGVNLSQGMSELYLRLDFRSGKNPSKYTYPYRVKGKMLILENPITQTGDPVLIGELYFASASITGAVESAVQPEDLNSASNYLHRETIGYAQNLGFSITPKIISTIPVYPLEAYTDVTGPNAGSMVIEVDGVSTTTLGIDLGAATNYEHVAALLQDRLDFLIPTITITYLETGPAWTMDIGDTNATHIDEVRGYALSGVDDIAWLFGWSSTNNPVVVDGVGYITTAVQPEDLGTAAWSNSTDFVSSSVDNLTAWDTEIGGIEVSGIPQSADGYIPVLEVPGTFGDAVFVEHFDSVSFGNAVTGDTADYTGIPSLTTGFFGSAAFANGTGPIYGYRNSWGDINQSIGFNLGGWYKRVGGNSDARYIAKLIDSNGDIILSIDIINMIYGNRIVITSDIFSLSGSQIIITPWNTWHHYLVSYDPTGYIRVFVDGVLTQTQNVSGNFLMEYAAGSTTESALSIIGVPLDGSHDDSVDEVYFEVGTYYSAGFTPPTSPLGSSAPSPKIQASSIIESNLVSAINLATTALQTNDVGSAAFASTNDFATAAEGDLAITALQTNDVGSAAFAETSDFATAAEGDIAASLAYSWYGVSWTTNQTSPDLTRTGNLGMHKTLPIQEQMYACVLNDSGEEVYILDGDDWTKTDFGYASNLDGTDGQVMIHLPEFYFDAWTNSGIITWAIAPEPLVGFEKMPEQYVSAFEASCYRAAGVTTNLCSVINTNTAYRGGNNTAAWDGTASNLLGKAATNLSRTQFRTYARSRGTGWEMYNYLAHRSITILFTVEYATKNSQKAVNLALDSNGFKQGGLGTGVTTVAGSAWTAFNGQYPFVPCGTAISLASGTGQVEYTLPAAFSNTVSSVMVPVYRGVENPFGHIWKVCDGVNVQMFANGEVDPSSYAWISNDPSTWNDSNYTGYLNIGKLPRTNGFVTSMLIGHILPLSVGGSSDTYWCDYFNASLPGSGSILRTVRVGGAASSSSSAGLVFYSLNSVPEEVTLTFATRLCYFPQN